jgi:hypothetical protein
LVSQFLGGFVKGLIVYVVLGVGAVFVNGLVGFVPLPIT